MQVYKPIKRVFVPKKAAATLALPADDKEAAPTAADAEVVELQGDDGWLQWQDSIFVEEFTDATLQTIPGAL